MKTVKIEDSWYERLKDEFSSEYFAELKKFLVAEKQQYVVFPPGSQIFNAFDTTPFDKVKVVILGQDPYHTPGFAHGLCFSVQYGVQIPKSLQNIYKELNSDIGFQIPNHGNLTRWLSKAYSFSTQRLPSVHIRQVRTRTKGGRGLPTRSFPF
jgi:uracil-DNA glycosylase